MIDTVCLLIPKNKVILLDLQNDGVPRWDLHSKTDNYEKFVKNPSKRDKESGYYFPRLTTYNRKFGQEAYYKAEFSAPKLLFKNNLDELSDADFPNIVTALTDRLRRMGVVVEEETISKSGVTAVHFSKNIILKDDYTSSYIISELNKIDLRQSFDFARTRFINNGQSLYAHTTAHQLVIYDKIADLAKTKKRAIDKEQTHYQMSLFKELKKKPELLEILRIEIRITRKQKLNKLLQEIGHNKDPSFNDIFSESVSTAIVQSYWKKIIHDRNLGLFTVDTTHKQLLRSIYKAYPTITPNRAIYLTGLLLLAKDEGGMRELRSLLKKKSADRTWYRLTKDLRELSQKISKNRIRSWVQQIDNALTEYKPIKPKDYE